MTFFWTTFYFSISLRIAISFWPFSGENTPPIYGDFEAQRHWKEITIHLPIKEWYTYKRDYWPLDYPPLTAYHEWLMGQVGVAVLGGDAFALDTSRGFESENLRLFMRMSVLMTDLLIYYSAIIFLFFNLSQIPLEKREKTCTLLLLNPILILTDHGHFQYNCAALGFFIWAVLMILRDRFCAAAVFYCFAILFKQTMLYFSPVFFFFLLGKSWKEKLFLQLAGTVVSVFAIILAPFAVSSVSPILVAVFPFHRGVFEDFVANFWILISPVLRLRSERRLVEIANLAKVSSILTLASVGECLLNIFRNPKRDRFALALSHCSLAFYLFSWQVHEKAICLPLTALCLAPLGKNDEKIFSFVYLVSFFSMLRLFEKDLLVLPAILVNFAFSHFFLRWNLECVIVAIFGILLGSVLPWAVSPPENLPHFWSFCLHAFCAVCFLWAWRKLLALQCE